ncbi:transcription initiation protein SPT3 homolog [Thrips palmi]|uniref:Transcription initiation protein SPT3 homolog n=1 Tax=Thrips palmi TaxID=161013 RepID=A0A6P9AE01_THRPL|nr:transcription initiation protein SPT3 homolog [Thrips palmi]XP_034255710.1 transcription initiation protein SPT3 homolog [Thrips palmi]
MSETEQIYLHEIQLMMHGCGDCAKPLQSTAKVVASIVQQQALNIAWRAEEQAIRRGFKTVTPRDIIFLMRNNPDKLRRLYSYLSVKEMRTNFTSLAGSDVMEAAGEEMEGDVSNFKGESAKKSRLASLRDMFTEIDTSGELIDSLNSPSLDPIRQKREQRADSMSQSLDPAGYFEFSNARRAAFVNSKLTQHRFLEWLTLGIDTSQGLAGEPHVTLPRISSPAIDILAYLAKETVAMLVDFALMVRQDSCGTFPGGPLRPLTLRPPSNSNTANVLEKLPITPAEIREALRRYWSPVFTQSAGLVRAGPPLSNQLMAC